MKKMIFLSLTLLLILACSLPNPAAEQTPPEPAPGMEAESQPEANSLPPSDVDTTGVVTTVGTDALLPEDFEYIGAFRLPGGEDPPKTFAYGGNAMTFNPDGDPNGAADGFPGTLFITGHERIGYGAVPDGAQVAEVNIPVPVISSDVESLPTAEFVQDFANIFEDHFVEFQEQPKVGLQYLNRPETGPLIHTAWGEHLQRDDFPSHGWFNPTLSDPDFQGEWFIGNVTMYSVNGYMLDIPTDWADAYVGGRYLGTGRMRDGGQGGMGPTLFAYRPWNADGSPPPSGTRLEEVSLLLYENAYNTEDIYHAMNSYQHPDAWEGGAWLTTPSGKQALLFAGTKGTGEKYWYGYINTQGPQYACVDTAHNEEFTTCRMADGSPCPPEDFSGCCNEDTGTCASDRGWWSSRFDAQLILYDSADLARVAQGEMEAWEPQPYAVIDIDEHLYLNPPEWDEAYLGYGDQRVHRVGDVGFDRANGLLYVLEWFADGGKPVVHVWRVQ